jgi:tetratricopeptide (TPR) repeat protein
MKEAGTQAFKEKKYSEARGYYTKAINLYLHFISTHRIPKAEHALWLKITQCYTNRCLCNHHLGDPTSILEDADYVLSQLDKRNQKALFRRKEVYKQQQKWSDCLRDLDLLLQIEPTDALKKEIKETFTLHTD